MTTTKKTQIPPPGRRSTTELRDLFLEFFRRNEHAIVPSSPLVPGNDPTLLFTNAGMVQFKDVFLGKDKRPYARAASSQRCVRAGGKHNDLENVGYTARHHTFFEMLGNFSFGDYFKRDAIRFAWEFVTGKDWLGIDPKRLMVTVYRTDDEAYEVWRNVVGLASERIVRIGDKPGGGSDNFWQMGETGPCGPCTEIFYDHGADIPGGPPGSPDAEGDRWIEIWNLVFMQFDRSADGTLAPLPKPSVDTGMGLERVAAVMQGVHSNYEIDLFQGLVRAAAKIAGTTDFTNSSLRVIADHIRACSFLIVDGVLPSNEGRGYVLRRIIRRAIRHGYKLGVREPFFHKLVTPLEHAMGAAYPELTRGRGHVEKVLEQEEVKFAETLAAGMRHLEAATSVEVRVMKYLSKDLASKYPGDFGIELRTSDGIQLDGVFGPPGGPRAGVEIKKVVPSPETVLETIQNVFARDESFAELIFVFVGSAKRPEIPRELQERIQATGRLVRLLSLSESDLGSTRIIDGGAAYKLYDTYGFPVDMVGDFARENGYTVDMRGFEAAMEAQRDRARASSKFGVEMTAGVTIEGRTQFLGHEGAGVVGEGRIVQLLSGGQKVDRLVAGEEGQVVLDRTPFYAEAGGQVGDAGVLTVVAGTDAASQFIVHDTQKVGNAHAHIGLVSKGEIKIGDAMRAEVNVGLRDATRRNHTATHLLHAALRAVLGTHVTQKGSLVAPDRLRFDFSHYQAVTPEELRKIEHLVNAKIRENAPAETNVMAYDDAVAAGAMALFGEKYESDVRVLRVGAFSMELCGGTHVRAAGDIGLFKIVGESGIASGVRRIEALTGEGAVNWVEATDDLLRDIAGLVKGDRKDVRDKVEQLIERGRKLEKEVSQLKGKLASGQGGGDLASSARDVNGIKVVAVRIDGADAKALRDAVDQLKSKLKSAVIVLGSVEAADKVLLVAGVTQDQTAKIKAGELIGNVAQQVGGRGGGRPDMAQAGGTNPAGLDAALASVEPWVRERLGA